MMIRRLYSRHTPKDLEEYRDLSEKDIKKMSNQEKFDFLDDEYDKAGRNEFRYGKKKFKKHGAIGSIVGAGLASHASRGASKSHILTSGIVGGVGGGLVGGYYGYLRGENKAREEGHDRFKILEENAKKLDKANEKKKGRKIYDLYAKSKVYDELMGTNGSDAIKAMGTGKTIIVNPDNSFEISEKRFNEDSEKKKKDSDFSWGKALGATAAVAGTMYGAKKGMFGNSIRRGYNTVYGHVGNALGSKSMIKSAASDYARGTNPQSKADFRKAYGEFNNKFDLTKGYKTTAPKTAQEAGMKTLDQIKNTTSPANIQTNANSFLTGQGFTTTTPKKSYDNLISKDSIVPSVMSPQTKPLTGPLVNKFGNSEGGNAVWALHKGTIQYTPKNSGMATGSIMQPKPVVNTTTPPKTDPIVQSIPTAQQKRTQRITTGSGAENYKLAKEIGYKTEKTVRHKITPEEKARRTQEYNQRVQQNKNKKNAGLMGVNTPDSGTFYATPEMFQQRTMSVLENFKIRRFFSEKEDSSRKKKIRNAALLGAAGLGLGALTVYGIKKGKNSRKNIKELEKTVKQNNQKINELEKERGSVLTNLKKSEKELGELHKKAKALANGEYKYSQKEIDEFNKAMSNGTLNWDL